MTEEEIEKQAEEYLLAQEGVCVGGCEYSYHHNNVIKKAFQTGAKWGMEHAIEWHDLRKCPDDLPKCEEVLKDYLVAFQNFNNSNEIVVGCFTWNGVRFLENYNYSEIPYFENKNVLYAWCELPTYKE